MNENVFDTSPTLGFIIKTIEHKGYAVLVAGLIWLIAFVVIG